MRRNSLREKIDCYYAILYTAFLPSGGKRDSLSPSTQALGDSTLYPHLVRVLRELATFSRTLELVTALDLKFVKKLGSWTRKLKMTIAHIFAFKHRCPIST